LTRILETLAIISYVAVTESPKGEADERRHREDYPSLCSGHSSSGSGGDCAACLVIGWPHDRCEYTEQYVLFAVELIGY
jgi:hypothetical protein